MRLKEGKYYYYRNEKADFHFVIKIIQVFKSKAHFKLLSTNKKDKLEISSLIKRKGRKLYKVEESSPLEMKAQEINSNLANFIKILYNLKDYSNE